jgi:sec-independent protein translocase protein TatA
MLNPLALSMPAGAEWLVIAALGLLIFGKRLPEVGRSLGKGIVEFKKGLKGVESEIEQVDQQIDDQAAAQKRLPDPATSSVASDAKFDPYTGKPIDPDEAAMETPEGQPRDAAAQA